MKRRFRKLPPPPPPPHPTRSEEVKSVTYSQWGGDWCAVEITYLDGWTTTFKWHARPMHVDVRSPQESK